jgi:hypothetical protein
MRTQLLEPSTGAAGCQMAEEALLIHLRISQRGKIQAAGESG